jgi:hypothetical protein
MDNYQNTPSDRLADGDETLFLFRMERVFNGQRERIAKYGGGLFKGNAMFPDVLPGFTVSPFEDECHNFAGQRETLRSGQTGSGGSAWNTSGPNVSM